MHTSNSHSSCYRLAGGDLVKGARGGGGGRTEPPERAQEPEQCIGLVLTAHSHSPLKLGEWVGAPWATQGLGACAPRGFGGSSPDLGVYFLLVAIERDRTSNARRRVGNEFRFLENAYYFPKNIFPKNTIL